MLDDLPPLPPPSDASVAAGFRRVDRYVRSRSLEQPKPGDGDQPAFVSREPNAFPQPVTPGNHALAALDAAYSMAPYVLGPDEALLITGRWPECRCANVSLWNRHLQTYDYAHRRVSLNRAQTNLDADGSFRDGDRARRPGRAELARHRGPSVRDGVLALLPAGGEIVTPQAKVVKLTDL